MALPDFPQVKARLQQVLVRIIQQQIPQIEPLLAGLGHQRCHEGGAMDLTRADATTEKTKFQYLVAEANIPRELRRRITTRQLLEYAHEMASQFARQQSKMVVETLAHTIDETGNTVSAEGIGPKEAFLEMHRRMQMDFDSETLLPKPFSIVMHPTRVANFEALLAEWEADPQFLADRARIWELKLEEWRVRENSRKLVD